MLDGTCGTVPWLTVGRQAKPPRAIGRIVCIEQVDSHRSLGTALNSTLAFNGNRRLPLGRGNVPFVAALGAAVLSAGTLAALLGPTALAVAAGLALAYWFVRHPHALLATYLAIGVFKGTALLKALPVDGTLLLAVLLAVVCIERVLSGRALAVPLGFAAAFALLGSMLVVSLTWTPVPGYGAEKAIDFWTLTLLAALAPFCLIHDARDLRRLFAWLLVTACVAAVVALVFGSVTPGEDINDSNFGRLEFGGVANTIFTSRLICVGVIVALFAPAIGLGGRWRLALPVAGVGLLAVAAAIGSRGPVLSLALALACTLAALLVRNPRAVGPLILVVALAAAALPLVPLPETSVARLQGVAQDPLGTLRDDGRSRLYDQAITVTREHPLAGIGAGGFFLYSPILTRKDLQYPHNIVLEVASELGVAAAIALLALIAAALVGVLRRGWRETRQRYRMLIWVAAALLLYTLFNAQLSGDINENRTLWTALALGWLIARHGVPSESAGPIQAAGFDEPEKR
jgi:O-antigen ligase